MQTHFIIYFSFQALADHDAIYEVRGRILTFPKDVSPDKDMRDAGVTAKKKLEEFNVELR